LSSPKFHARLRDFRKLENSGDEVEVIMQGIWEMEDMTEEDKALVADILDDALKRNG
jgi:hypothetical protein